ncbi:unnamed protein product, partial [marine sediment metagenome]
MALLEVSDLKIELNITDESDTEWDVLLGVLALAVENLFDEMTDPILEEAEYTEYHDGGKYCQKIFLKN